MKKIIINGSNICDVESFYVEIDNVMTKGLDWKTGHNLNAFNDILVGGFGVHDYDEPFKLIWSDFTISQSNLEKDTLELIIEIIKEHEKIELILK